MSVADDLNRAARNTGKQRNMVLIALLAVIALGVYLGGDGIQQDLSERSAAALDEAALPTERINVSIDGRTAKLTGFADSQSEADDAVATVTAVEGIGTVENFLQVKQEPLLTGPAGEPPNAAAELMASTPDAAPDAETAGPTVDADSDETAALEVVDNGISYLRAEWDNGRLTITGALGTAAELRHIKDVLAHDYGDATVVNNIVLQDGLPPAEWLAGFTAHLPDLRAQNTASMESSAAGLRPATADQEVYVVAADVAPEVEAPATAPVAESPDATPGATPNTSPVADELVEKAPVVVADIDDAAPVASSQDWIHLRSQIGRVAISGVLGSERERRALATALRVVYPPNVTWNSVRIGDQAEQADWLATLNSMWVLLQQVESLDIEVSATGVSVSGWTPSEDQSRRIQATLADKFAPLPVKSGLRSIQAQNESYAAAELFNRSYARGIGFARDGVSLSWAGHVTLAQIAKRLRRQPAVRLQIGVHTDGRGSAEANLRLTEKRAEAIAAKLRELGVGAERVQVTGYGASRPIADNRSPIGRSLNRRVVFSPL